MDGATVKRTLTSSSPSVVYTSAQQNTDFGMDVTTVELNVYPHSLAARFLLASLLAFAVFFAVASGTARTAGAILLVVVGVGLLELFSGLFGLGIDVIGPVLDSMREWPGPLEVFGGRWVLIDY